MKNKMIKLFALCFALIATLLSFTACNAQNPSGSQGGAATPPVEVTLTENTDFESLVSDKLEGSTEEVTTTILQAFEYVFTVNKDMNFSYKGETSAYDVETNVRKYGYDFVLKCAGNEIYQFALVVNNIGISLPEEEGEHAQYIKMDFSNNTAMSYRSVAGVWNEIVEISIPTKPIMGDVDLEVIQNFLNSGYEYNEVEKCYISSYQGFYLKFKIYDEKVACFETSGITGEGKLLFSYNFYDYGTTEIDLEELGLELS